MTTANRPRPPQWQAGYIAGYELRAIPITANADYIDGYAAGMDAAAAAGLHAAACPV